jgi:histidine ammonia-lyase
LSDATSAAPHPLSTDQFVVPTTGTVAAGDYVFEASDHGVSSLELLFIDSDQGNMDVPLFGHASPTPHAIAGPANNGLVETSIEHGFIFSNANWDPYPLGNRVEAFTIALANMDIAIMLRQERFQSTFFTLVRVQDVLSAAAAGGDGEGGGGAGSWTNHEVWQRIQGLINPVPPEGYSGDPQGVEELDAETNFKIARAVQTLRESWLLLAGDLVVGARWMDVRKAQDADRDFGTAPTAAWQAFRKLAPLPSAAQPPGTVLPPQNITALAFIEATPAASFYPGGPPMPAGR